jgi:hypothetical protein
MMLRRWTAYYRPCVFVCRILIYTFTAFSFLVFLPVLALALDPIPLGCYGLFSCISRHFHPVMLVLRDL